MDVAASEFLMRDSGSGSYDLDFKSANDDGKQVLTGAALGDGGRGSAWGASRPLRPDSPVPPPKSAEGARPGPSSGA